MTRDKVVRLCALIVGVAGLVWLSIQDIRIFLVEDEGVEYFHSDPIMLLVCLLIGIAVGLTVHFVLEWKKA